MFDDGAVETRQGTTLLNTAAIGSFIIEGLYTRRAQDESETMVAIANGTAYDLQVTSFITIGSAQSVFTTGVRIGSVEAENNRYFGDGVNVPYKWNGTDWTRHGVYPPSGCVDAATGAAGVLTGDYQYKVTWIVTSIPVAPQSFGISSRRIYRTEAGDTTFKLLATLSNNTQTAYTDNISDSVLGAAAPTDQGVPPLWDVACYQQDRIFMNDTANKNLVKYTEAGNPYVVKTTNFRRFGDNTGNNVHGLVAYNNGVVITGDERMAFIYMPSGDDSTWLDIELKVPYGSKSPYSLLPFKDRLIFPATENRKFVGFGAVVGNTIEPDATFLTVLTAGGDLISNRMEDDVDLIQDAQVKDISGIVFKDRLYICVSYGASQTTNNRVYVLNYGIDNLSKKQKFSWSPWTGLNANQFTLLDNELYYCSSTASGQVFKMLDGTYTDNGSAINSYYWTKELAGFRSEENNHKDFRYLYLLATLTGNWNMGINARVNSDTSDGDSYTVNLVNSTSLYGTAVYGTDLYAAGFDESEFQVFLGALKGKRVQFKFHNENTASQWFRIFWFKYAYNKKGFRS
jgi:hypothetical protein